MSSPPVYNTQKDLKETPLLKYTKKELAKKVRQSTIDSERTDSVSTFNSELSRVKRTSFHSKPKVSYGFMDLTFEEPPTDFLNKKRLTSNEPTSSSKNFSTVSLIEEDKPKFTKLSLKKSKLLNKEKILSPFTAIKGNLDDHLPMEIIAGYEKKDGGNVYLVRWYSLKSNEIFPSLIDGESLMKKNPELIAIYLENLLLNIN